MNQTKSYDYVTKLKKRKKWERLKLLDQMTPEEEISYSADLEHYILKTPVSIWRDRQEIRTLGTMKTYLLMNQFEYDCALYEYEKLSDMIIMTPHGRASIEEILLALCLRNIRKPDYDLFKSALTDYECDKDKVIWIFEKVRL